MKVADSDLAKLLDSIDDEIPTTNWKAWPGGRQDQIEAALIDAVLSIRAKYGSETNGVRGAVARYKDAVGDPAPNDLCRLAQFDAKELQAVLGNQFTSGRTKASAITEAAAKLCAVGVINAVDLDPRRAEQKGAYTSVHGLSWVTWEYFGMLLDRPGVKADRWITRFVVRALERDVKPQEARDLLLDAASKLEVSPMNLDHAIWDYERNRPNQGGGGDLPDEDSEANRPDRGGDGDLPQENNEV